MSEIELKILLSNFGKFPDFDETGLIRFLKNRSNNNKDWEVGHQYC